MVIVGFEWYSEDSLKQLAWKARSGKDYKKRNDYLIEPDTDLSKRCMRDILGTKISLTTLLIKAVERHLEMKNIAYFIAGNSVIRSSFADTGTTNHTEGETAIIMGLSVCPISESLFVEICVDLFVLHLVQYGNINCSELFMKTLGLRVLHRYTCFLQVMLCQLYLLSMHSPGVTSVVSLPARAFLYEQNKNHGKFG